ncbi:Receptor-type guanylate cyclase gcy [Seminavis robusta]|uniref:Receptor-type guanylate cyclase gcy n=1 Tax=Seminavis robusta TaxID=568900 RepID=A0A9N8EW40_9STRA|nr:Receptor-type guanylate cyclase gcy [Seminavis robusta]|eukprot:Sro1866_g302510.1 Receptor-type guanylate cyclase gcy (1480) ;mRNA; f:6885-13267
MELPAHLRNSMHKHQQRTARAQKSRPSMLIQQPMYYRDESTTAYPGQEDNPYNLDLDESEEEDDSYSYTNSDDDDDNDSFAGGGYETESDDGKLSPEEARKREMEKQQKIGAKEHQRVFRARLFVVLLFLGTACANALIVYYLNVNHEYDDYYFHFNELATEIIQGTQENVRVVFQAMDAMSVALTTRVGDDPTTAWPLVTFRDFAILAENVRNVTGAWQIVFVPIVMESQRQAWEQYSVDNQFWVREEFPLITEDAFHERLLQAASANQSSSTTSSSEMMRRMQYYDAQQQQSQYMLYDGTESLRYPPPTPQQTRQSSQHNNETKRQQQEQQERTRRRQQYVEHNLRGVIPSRIHPAPTREERLTQGMHYAPVWQMSPVPYYRGIINHDMYREPSFHHMSHYIHDNKQAVISNQLNDPIIQLFVEEHNARENPYDYFDETTSTTTSTSSSSNIFTSSNPEHSNQQYPPTGVLVQPVWDSLNPLTASVAGYLIAMIPWETYLVDSFRADSEEAVLARYQCETTSEQESLKFNYKAHGGQSVTYLGPGDIFNGESEFDFNVERTMTFPIQPPSSVVRDDVLEQLVPTVTNYTNATNGTNATNTTHAPPLSECRIEIKFYPSEELRTLYITTNPVYYALMVLSVFVLLALVFYIYNCFVERRRGRAMAVAEKTNRIVTSLFPSHFADQLISEDKKKEKENKKKKKKKVVIEEAPTRQLKKFMNDKNSKNNSSSVEGLGFGEGDGGETPLFLANSKPIADLFPETTVLFADIAGFTAWSSVREPSQVFTLLETIYQNFDFLAKQYGIFKIETIGDCYVAVCGLPEPRADHAVAMSRFSIACLQKMKGLVSELEVTLGPDTGDLTIRTGLHSGPVTAGVLRGERARFQLFGDTVNTAARMESTGMRDKIQISQETADLLVGAGKSHWLTKRDGLVKAKGKGDLQTYWLKLSSIDRRGSIGGERRRHSMGGPSRTSSVRDSFGGCSRGSGASSRLDSSDPRRMMSANSDRNVTGSRPTSEIETTSLLDRKDLPVKLSKKQQRLVEWNCEMIQQLLRQIVARRNFLKNASKPMHLPFTAMMSDLPKFGAPRQQHQGVPLDEVVEVINLPEFDVAAYVGSTDAKHIRLDPVVVTQLKKFISLLASRYRDNPFHNFDHASHVAMSVGKLLTRIVAPDLASINERHDNNHDISNSIHVTNDMKDLHDHTYGITSDPLTQLAVVLSALIHDADHRGVPNNILIKEEPEMAAKYNNKSVAEQNSVDIAWEIFMADDMKELRETICPEFTELRRLRQIIVSSVLATDIFDPELSALRKARWNKAFQQQKPKRLSEMMTPFDKRRSSFNVTAVAMNSNPRHEPRHEVNRKATIVIEHLIQASDVAHTMQHWHIYQKWNECLFKEMYQCYKQGRSDKDPSEGWYKGEIWFFDNYVIPLAKKLKDCGVFGVSSDEYLIYAEQNKAEWEEKGEAIVASMLEKYGDAVDRAALGYE